MQKFYICISDVLLNTLHRNTYIVKILEVITSINSPKYDNYVFYNSITTNHLSILHKTPKFVKNKNVYK